MDKQPSIVLAGAARTAIGSFGGGLADVSAHKLGAITIQAALERAKTAKDEVDDVILGQVLTAGQGQNPARQAAIEAGIAQQTPAMTLNQVCGSGLRTVALGAQQIACGDADIVVTGGQENMSLSTHCMHLRRPKKMGDGAMLDTMISDGLWDAFNSYHMGQTAENIAQKWQISREIQDDFALRSQQNAEKAQASGKFAEEIVPVTISSRKGDVTIDQDEYIRHGATLESLTKLRPAFAREGSVTAGNASGINDGAAAIILMSEANAEARGLEPLGRIVSWASVGVDPAIMGTGPIPASQKALKRAGWTVDMLDLVEANEAFAAQACAVNQEMGWDTDKVNVNGGAIALGHPIGASGARILVTLLFEMRRRDAKRGLATLCIGGGMGVSVCVER